VASDLRPCTAYLMGCRAVAEKIHRWRSEARAWGSRVPVRLFERLGFPGTGMVARQLRPDFARPEHEVSTEPDTMDKDTAELAYRRGAGIEVTLLWHRTNGELTVSVTDAASGASFELPVAPAEALTAFHHPYAYAAVKGVAY
jgi:hypothetical protein